MNLPHDPFTRHASGSGSMPRARTSLRFRALTFRRGSQVMVAGLAAVAISASLSAGPVEYAAPVLVADGVVCGTEDGQSQRATTYDAPCLPPEATKAVDPANPGDVELPVEEEDPAPVEGAAATADATTGTASLMLATAPEGTDPKVERAGDLPVWVAATGEDVEQDAESVESAESTTEVVPSKEPSATASATATASASVSTKAPSGKAARETRVDVAVVPDERAKAARNVVGTWGPVIHLSSEDAASRGGAGARPAPGLEVKVDTSEYDGKAAPVGGGWENRLRLVAYPECVLETPKAKKCRQGTWLETSRDAKGRLVAMVPGAGTASSDSTEKSGGASTESLMMASSENVVLMTVSEPSGDGGDWKATSLGPASTWSGGGSAGSFTWSYPLRTPPVASGMEPELALSYDSGSVDGVIGSSNVQAGWAGLGWDIPAGFMERTYVPCGDDQGEFESKTANNATRKTGDQCWRGEVLNLSAGAHAGEAVSVGGGAADGSGEKFRLRTDDGSTLTRRGVRGGANEHFELTTTDGTTYVFGQVADTEGPGASWRMPVYGNHPGEPGHDTTFGGSSKEVVWRWNLWQVIDPRGNTMTYHWATERNRYRANTNIGAVPDEERGGTPVSYDRGGYLTKITYGTRTGSTGASAARVIFETAERCRTSYDCTDSTGKPLGEANANQWPDVPFDLVCASGADCKAETQAWPSFFSTKRLSRILTETNTGTAGSPNFVPVDEYTLKHGFPKKVASTDEVTLWLSKITHRAGHATVGAGKLAGSVSFGATNLNNRVDPGTTAGPPMYRPRIDTIVNELGAKTGVSYTGHNCVIDGVYPDPADNQRRCFPSEASYEGVPSSKHWFHKYVVKQVDQDPGIGTTVRTTYTYGDVGSDDAAWAKSDDPMVLDRKRRWTQWRGYAQVTTRVGDQNADGSGHPRTNTVTTYHRGLGPGGQGLDPDARPLAGRVLMTETYAGTTLVKSVATTYDVKLWNPTVADGGRVPRRVQTTKTATTAPRAAAVGGGTQHVDVSMAYDGAGREIRRSDHAYTKTSGAATPDTVDRTCLYTTYPTDLTAPQEGLTSYPSQSRRAAGGCGTTPPAVGDLLEGTQWAYDGQAVGASPTEGLVMTTKTIDHTGADGGDGTGTIGWVTTAATTYDTYGRVKNVTDAAGNTTKTTYEPSDGRTATEITTTSPDPDGSGPLTAHETITLNDPKWGQPTKVTDAADGITIAGYDSLGRLEKVTMPGNTTTTPDLAYTYHVRGQDGAKVNAITTETLNANGVDTKTSSKQLTSVSIFDSLGRTVQTQDETRWTDDANKVATGRVISSTGYDAAGRVADVDNQLLANGLPQASYVTSQVEAPEHVTTTYDGASRPLRQTTTWTNADGTTSKPATSYVYDGNLTHTTPPDGGVATTTVTDPRGRTSQIWRHTDGTANSDATDATKIETRYTYTPTGLLATVKDEKPNTWSYTYDQRGRRTKTVDPDAGTSTTTYNQLGLALTSKDGNGQVLTSAYDNLGRQTGLYETNTDGSRGDQLSGWAYDTVKKGLLTSSTKYDNNQPVHITKVNKYDTAGRPTSAQTEMRATDGIVPAELAGTYQIDQAYQVDGLPTSTSYFPVKSGSTQVLAAEKLTTEYDALGRPIRLGGSMGQYVVGTAWSAYGQLDQLALGNTYGTISWQSYKYASGSGRMLEEQYDRQTRPELDQQLTYTYDLAGNATSIRTDKQANGAADVLWQETECFSYDGLNRLKAAWSGNAQQCGVFPTSTEIPAGHGYAVMYEFDDETFNRSKQTYRTNVGETIASYDYPATAADGPVHAPSKVTTTSTGTADSGVAGTAGTYTYTAAGQMKTRPTPATGDAVDQALAWDAEHHLASVDGADTAGDQAGFYDTTGSRVIRKVTTGAGETSKTVTTAYLPGGLEVIHDTSKTGADEVTARRTYGFAGQTVATRTGNDPADVTTWGMDSQGTPEYGIANAEDAALTGSTESSPRRRDRPFGGDRGALPSEKEFPGDIGFVGSTRDEDAGILQVGARPYDPYMGLFLTTDPVVDPTSPGSLNAYGYANQNPVTNSDPTGLAPTCQLDSGGSGGSCNYNPATGTVSNFVPSTAPAPPPPAPASPTSPADPVSIPGKEFYDQPGVSDKELENYLDDEEGQSETGILLARNAFACTHPDTEVGRYCGESSMECTGVACGSTEGLEDVFVWYVGEPDELDSAGTIFDLALSFSILKIFKQIPIGAAKTGARACSFSGTTLVLMADGTKKPIEKVEKGDKVLATDPETAEQVAKTVTGTIRHWDRMSDLVMADGTVLRTTEDHPYWSVDDQRFERADELEAGERVLRADGREIAVAGGRWLTGGDGWAYNLSVEGIHTYHVGDDEILVHNTCDITGGFKVGVGADEIGGINAGFGGSTLLNGSPANTLANASRYGSFWDKSAVVIRDIAGGHMYDNGNKRTAQAVVEQLMHRNGVVSGPTSADLRGVIDQVGKGQLHGVDDIAAALRGY